MDIGCLEHDSYTQTPTNKFGIEEPGYSKTENTDRLANVGRADSRLLRLASSNRKNIQKTISLLTSLA